MENKLNRPALEQYAAEFSSVLADQLFANKDAVNGKEILENSRVKQVGLFVLYTLFKKWKVEADQLKSPYFNYENPDVKNKLNELLNTLSQNIRVSKESLMPLLTVAVEQTLLLILSPLKYYEDLVASFGGQTPDMNEVKNLQRFIKINGHMRDALLSAWASNGNEGEVLDKAFEGLSEPPEDVNALLEPFNELLPIEAKSFWDNELESPAGDVLIEEDEDRSDIETVHTRFSSEKPTTLGDTLGFKTNNTSLKSMLTINQKFMFVNDLFKGNQEDFTKVIEFLDTCETKEVVHKFLDNNYIKRGDWKREAPQVKEFMQLIEKKFS